MTGLRLMNEIMDPVGRDQLLIKHTFTEFANLPERDLGTRVDPGEHRSIKVRTDIPIPAVPYLDRKTRIVPQLSEVWSYINPFMLFGRHLGYKGNFEKSLLQREPKALELFARMEEWKAEASAFMKVRCVWQFFEAERAGNAIHLFCPGAAEPIHTFQFGRQPRADGLSLSDYVLQPVDGKRDHLALFVVTAGQSVREHADKPKPTATSSRCTPCGRWPSKPLRVAPSGSTAASVKVGPTMPKA
ncbi:MAG: vitamin B12 dependent-methionine synthase activation domain-containing protein [Bryobacteraceae bacterium]